MRVQPNPWIRGDNSRGGPANDGIALGHGNRDTVRAGDGKRPFGYEMQHFVEDKRLELPNLGRVGLTPLLAIAALTQLLMQTRESEKGLQRLVTWRISNRRNGR
jgi:hypothetical protein